MLWQAGVHGPRLTGSACRRPRGMVTNLIGRSYEERQHSIEILQTPPTAPRHHSSVAHSSPQQCNPPQQLLKAEYKLRYSFRPHCFEPSLASNTPHRVSRTALSAWRPPPCPLAAYYSPGGTYTRSPAYILGTLPLTGWYPRRRSRTQSTHQPHDLHPQLLPCFLHQVAGTDYVLQVLWQSLLTALCVRTLCGGSSDQSWSCHVAGPCSYKFLGPDKRGCLSDWPPVQDVRVYVGVSRLNL